MPVDSYGLYIHFPWCIKKCPYCDFNSHTLSGELAERQYIKALVDDLKTDLTTLPTRQLSSIFMGGGTPSLFSAQSLDYLLNQINQLLPINQSTEITLEANPGTFEKNKFADYFKAGINRLSIGVQSFDNAQLTQLGRIHKADEAKLAIKEALSLGYERLNIDLMYGLKEQTISHAIADLKQAIELGVPHISWYQLTLEPNTVFYSKPPILPHEETIADIEQAGRALLAEYGLMRYEVSAYAKPKQACQHNLNYWNFGDYLGIGAGAHGKVTLARPNKIMRRLKHKIPKNYLDNNKDFLTQQTAILPAELPFEYMLNKLRLKSGFDLVDFKRKTGLEANVISSLLTELLHKKMLYQKKEKYYLTHMGENFLNDVVAKFMIDHA